MGELSITCELLKRRSQKRIMSLLLGYISLFVFVRLLAPHYSKSGEVLYRGILSQIGYGDYTVYAQLFYFFLLFAAPFVFVIILKRTLTIIGDITITEHKIIISRKQSILYKLNVAHLKHLEIQFNYFKRNDIEPRNMVKGNNNVIGFKKMGIPFNFEFLLQTKEEDEIFRNILDKWSENGITYQYRTGLSKF